MDAGQDQGKGPGTLEARIGYPGDRRIDPHALLRMQLALECKAVDGEGLVEGVPCPEPDDIARVAVVRLRDGFQLLVRRDVPVRVRETLRGAEPAELFDEPQRVLDALALDDPCTEWDRGRSYVFPAIPGTASTVTRLTDGALLSAFEGGFDEYVQRRPVYAIVHDGAVLSACVSIRENDEAAEAWVLTGPAHRRRGLARQVVAAWAHDVMAAGKVAFYSHSETNQASWGTARSLGLSLWWQAVAFA